MVTCERLFTTMFRSSSEVGCISLFLMLWVSLLWLMPPSHLSESLTNDEGKKSASATYFAAPHSVSVMSLRASVPSPQKQHVAPAQLLNPVIRPVVSCGKTPSNHSFAALLPAFQRALSGSDSGHIIIGTMSIALRRAAALHLLSLRRNAPRLLRSYVMVTYDEESMSLCTSLAIITCVHDPFVKEIGFDPSTRQAGMWSSDGGLQPSVYLELIWHKPELVRYALLSGADRVTLVDVDTLWMGDPTILLQTKDYAADLVTMAEHASPPPNEKAWTFCTKKARGLKRQVANTGFMQLRNSPFAIELTRRWLSERHCSTNSDHEELDQEALSRVGCDMERKGELSTRLLPSEVFVLNPTHRIVRARPSYNICNVMFFHSIICTPQKEECMLRHLKRTREWGVGRCEERGVLCTDYGGSSVVNVGIEASLCYLNLDEKKNSEWIGIFSS